ncbi:sodium:solute symporter family protein [Cyclobacterium marinum]|uniref:Na+/solute symporter n=1 Tax=Cyclobacterium marinum (strain ATCC 25205 / DSM 745 / LMG 13164 / NCIMB 1802) TaxID=880070 RepID=G0J7Y1_CYCMS|nr:sodium:solute symporter [Cyclobacterium marinum]AEL28650.1 Na+/solute symporter [Cyclobacterium marinum DSM 745]MBI0398492.1 sodium:solute symporter family protein [Cyclobacterium marinum]MBR9774496.1 sodium:solute symporter family protein [Cytophagales bacterium]|tara:strand:+ start:5778 stop:7199 length:1422 start_codon:yes stop_codon:yes gene_type:complete
MIFWVWVFGLIYAGMLVFASLKSYKKGRSSEEFMMAGGNIGLSLGVLTFAAALFSTFTFLGMPDFFRINGIGAWIFLAVSDGAMVFVLLWFGYEIRKKVRGMEFRGVSGLISRCYDNKLAGYTFFLSAFLFLIPYVGIQIQGIAIFMDAAFPESLPAWGWSLGIVLIMLTYSEIGGLKAIIFSDAIQGVLLLAVIWIIGWVCLDHFGGIGPMFEKVGTVKEELLSTPGPQGLLTPQFLLASLIAILMIPVTQPQFTTRIVVMKSMNTMKLMAVSLGAFAILVILPTVFIGMYGADLYGELDRDEFFANAFLKDQHEAVAALAIIGLIAAGLSTTNAMIFAMGSELRGLLTGAEKVIMKRTKIGIFVFSTIAFIFSIIVFDQLVLLARVSFAGTGIMGPMILLGILSDRKISPVMIYLSLGGLAIFLLSLGGIIPSMYFGYRLDLLLFIILGISAVGSYLSSEKRVVSDTKVNE